MTTPTKPDPDDLPPMTPEEEAEMAAEIERAIAPYRAFTPASLLAKMRENLEHALRTHPAPRAYLRSVAGRKPVAASTEVTRGGGEHEEPDKSKEGA